MIDNFELDFMLVLAWKNKIHQSRINACQFNPHEADPFSKIKFAKVVKI